MEIYDCGIIGMGVAGAFAAYKLSKDHKDMKIIGFDLGRPPAKRRRQIDGFLGCLPNGDGKIYLNDVNKVADIITERAAKSSMTLFNEIMSNVGDFKISKDKTPLAGIDKKLINNNYSYYLNDYIQIYPKDIHSLSKHLTNILEKNTNITFSYDNEVTAIHKEKDCFAITTDLKEYKCKKIIFAAGRSGWRWAKSIFNNFGIIDNNDYSNFGIRIETSSSSMKEFNKSNCTILKNDVEIGPLSWFGSVIPEDHVDLAISAFRSNENRWKSDKVSFSLIGKRYFPNNGTEQTDRIAKLTFILSNDRILREKVSLILSGKSKISIISEYDWLKDVLIDFSNIMPEILTKAYFHVPTITPLPPKVNIGTNLETEMNGLYIVGESAGVTGILSAALMGLHVSREIFK